MYVNKSCDEKEHFYKLLRIANTRQEKKQINNWVPNVVGHYFFDKNQLH
jgi:hypothetical protein